MGRRWQERRPEQGSLFSSPSGLSKHVTLAVSQQPKERVKIKWDFRPDTVPRAAFAAREPGKETIAPSLSALAASCPPQTQLCPQMLHNL